MAKYQIRYTTFGTIDQIEWETIEAASLDDAENQAYQCAVEDYMSYGGMHGLYNIEEEMENDPDLTEDKAHELMQEDIENWVQYEAQEYRAEDDPECESANDGD